MLVDQLVKLAEWILPLGLNDASLTNVYWRWKIRLMIYMFFVFIMGFLVSNIPVFPVLYPPMVIQGMFIFAFVYISIVKLLQNRPGLLSNLFLIYTIITFYASLRTSFLFTVCRAPMLIYICSLQTGKRSVFVVWVALATFMYGSYHLTDWVKEIIMRESLVICKDNVCTINQDLVIRVLNTTVWQSLGMAIMSYFSEMTLEDGARKLGEANYKLTEALKTKTEFLARCSHELRTPLNGIVGSVDVLQSFAMNNEQEKFLEIAKECSINLTDLINGTAYSILFDVLDLLDFSKMELDQLNISYGVTNIHEFLSKIMAPIVVIANKKSLDFSWKIMSDVPDWFVSDEFRLKQVLNNLLSNALKFTSRFGMRRIYSNTVSGSISVLVEFCTIEEKTIIKRLLKVSVTDSGIGVPQDRQEIIFEAFKQADDSTTRKYGGTGLGLAICKNIIEKIGGRIKVHSKETAGSTFYFEIPYIEPSPKQIEEYKRIHTAESDKEAVTLRRRKIEQNKVLIAEDNLVNQKVIQRILKNVGIEAELTCNGQEEQVVDKAKTQQFPLVLLDLEMPVKDGRTAVRELRQLPDYKSVPIIAFTAHVLSEEEKKHLLNDLGFTDFLIKPVSSVDVKKLFNKMWKT